MTYEQTIEFLYGQLPMFTRIGKAAYKADLNNTIALCRHLGDPQQKLKCIHIAGTNGKGSTSHMLASILQANGLKTGLYTSPHLKDFRERIRINGVMIPEKEIVKFVEANLEFIKQLKPSFFELCVGLCFDYFAKEKVDIAVIETGLGGRLDSTNIITPLLSVITNIGYDHMDLLGNTLQEIAKEKAGIIKENVPVVIGETSGETIRVFLERSMEENAPLTLADQEYSIENVSNNNSFMECDIFKTGKLLYKKLSCDLAGNYQEKNLCTVIAAVEELKEQDFEFEESIVRSALANVKKLSGLMGRWQVLSEKPLIICDTGHNEDGIRYVVEQLSSLPHKNLHIVFGMVNDKDISSVLGLLPVDAQYYFCQAALPRALNAEFLKEQAEKYGLKGESYASVREAFTIAKKVAAKDDVVFIGGSTFVVAEVL